MKFALAVDSRIGGRGNNEDRLAVSCSSECVLLVVANGMSSRKEIEDCLHHLPASNLIGTVLNKAELESHGYYP